MSISKDVVRVALIFSLEIAIRIKVARVAVILFFASDRPEEGNLLDPSTRITSITCTYQRLPSNYWQILFIL